MTKFLMTTQLGNVHVDVHTDNKLCGGSVTYCPEDPNKEKPRIVIGMDYGEKGWPRCLTVLMHEAWEFVLIQLNVRFERDGNWSSNLADYFFFFDHQVFAEACARVAYFMRDVVPKLVDAYSDQIDAEKRRDHPEYYNPY